MSLLGRINQIAFSTKFFQRKIFLSTDDPRPETEPVLDVSQGRPLVAGAGVTSG